VRIIRYCGGAERKYETHVNVERIMKNGEFEDDLPVRANDWVIVPQKSCRSSEAGRCSAAADWFTVNSTINETKAESVGHQRVLGRLAETQVAGLGVFSVEHGVYDGVLFRASQFTGPPPNCLFRTWAGCDHGHCGRT